MEEQCNNCKMTWYCKIIHWAGSRQTVYEYVNKYDIKNCHHFVSKLLIRIMNWLRKYYNEIR